MQPFLQKSGCQTSQQSTTSTSVSTSTHSQGEHACASSGGHRRGCACLWWAASVSSRPIPSSGPGGGCFVCVLFWWVWFFLFFLVSVYGRPKRLKSWDTGMWAPQVEPDAPTQGLHQARIFGHAVKQAPLLQEVRRGAALPDFSFVQDDHPARGGDTDVSGGEGVGTSCPQEPT